MKKVFNFGDLPLESTPSTYLDGILACINMRVANNCGSRVYGTVEPTQIVKYEHPNKIKDPLNV
ncbi:hypothetical protein M5X00_20945 [Paenibacillus alvei]|uniref:hypothetical protein n=1 Tax=Paenibacillus alvei TaxID=44250 RepID=UPI0002886CA6|nr:hypothetical protein [Paenibacillus alvei]EJW19330.1 hypothetical protein PAV_1c03040 [Paenibacillus alvei DSM 29]MCY9539373.1 hypothetical protein [Paenibacillus alvei]MCY9704797.1 hypothetical protein [Paenibacillus alvei]MCY9735924.1 hypothetical protein [Paenibacillus alvei]MCY9756711.1 hypothetical protein [Paenibacillus alvei]